MNNNFYKLNGSKYRINHDFFTNIDSEIQAYLLGFYIADGNVNQKRKTFRIKISEEDVEIVKLFKEFIAPDNKIIEYKAYEIQGRSGETYTGKPQVAIDINSAKLVNSLVSLGYGYNKTYSDLSLPDISDELKLHLIRGFIDGDGSISSYISKEKGKKDRARCCVSICSKTENFLKEIKKFLESKGVTMNISHLKRDDMFRLSTQSKEQIFKLYNLIYKDASYSLSRKIEKIKSYVNTEILPKTAEDCNAQAMSAMEAITRPRVRNPYDQGENVR